MSDDPHAPEPPDGFRAVRLDAAIPKEMIVRFGNEYIMACRKLHDSRELQELARSIQADPQLVAAEIALMGVAAAVSGYPGEPADRRVLLQVFERSLVGEAFCD